MFLIWFKFPINNNKTGDKLSYKSMRIKFTDAYMRQPASMS